MSKLTIRRAAVLGAGVMGAQIAAHLANADVPVYLFDLAAPGPQKNAVVNKAIDGLKKLEPTPLADKERVRFIDGANYDDHLDKLAECDLIIEAIAEKMAWKEDLYRRIAPVLAPHTVIASNTSGLSINRLAECLPAALRPQFCGIHFFNPPRYMSLVEIIATRDSRPAMLDQLESWLTTRLGKSVVRAKDTPNFVANRVGVFSLLALMHHAERLGLSPDVVDALTGPLIGRPKSATYRTGDVVGLDTLAHVVNTMAETLPEDPWHGHFQLPDWMKGLIAQGQLGQKTKGGVFRKVGKEIHVFRPTSGDWQAADGAADPQIAALLKQPDPAGRFAALRASDHPQAQLLWSAYRDVFHYCAVHLHSIADNARDVDFAMRWGFGWQQGPFETWQSAGWQEIAAAIEADRIAGLTLSAAPLPEWVRARAGVHEAQGSWSASGAGLSPRSSLSVYERQLYPERVLGEAADEAGETLFSNEGGVRLWTHSRFPRVGILSLTSKMHAIGASVLSGVTQALDLAESTLDALVLWQPAPFAVGANLQEVLAIAQQGDDAALHQLVKDFQAVTRRLKFSPIPVVAGVQGLALGGGCEFALQTAHRVFALESYPGLVEAAVGVIPAGGGCKELALAAARWAAQSVGGEPFPFLQRAFNTVSRATSARSALEAIALGFGRPGDDVVFHPQEVLFVALQRARAMAESAYRPPLPARNVPVAGRDGIATLEMGLVNLREGGYISAHDYRVARGLAVALCGGEVETGTRVDEDWFSDVERQVFVDLLKTAETQARIEHMLNQGKPLRN